jgi:hypothetical protein
MGVHAIVFDGIVERSMVATAEKADVKFLVGMDSKVRQNETRCNVLTVGEL